METTEITTLVQTPTELIQKVKSFKQELNTEQALKELHPETHKVMNTAYRKDKQVLKPTGLFDANNEPLYGPATEYVARIPLALQKLIHNRAAAFTATPVELESKPVTPQEETMDKMVDKTLLDNKMDFRNREILKTVMAEKECLELWRMDKVDPAFWGDDIGNVIGRMRVTILKPSEDNNVFYPIFDMYRDLTAFGRGYKIKVGGKEQERLDLYTSDFIYHFYSNDTGWILENEEKHSFGKLPLIYHYQERTEHADVEWIIERLEKLLSNFADTNDYFGSPMAVAKGNVTGFASKGESGKMLKLEGEGAEVKYLTWDQAPAAIKLEIDTLFDMIWTITQTANTTFKEMRGIGPLAGVAIKMMFIDAHNKAKDKQEGAFGECIQRRINLIKVGMAKINVEIEKAVNLTITPKFGLFMPDNELEQLEIKAKKLDILMQGNGNKPVIGHEESVNQAPFEIEDKKANWEAIQKLENEAKANRVTNNLFEDE